MKTFSFAVSYIHAVFETNILIVGMQLICKHDSTRIYFAAHLMIIASDLDINVLSKSLVARNEILRVII